MSYIVKMKSPIEEMIVRVLSPGKHKLKSIYKQFPLISKESFAKAIQSLYMRSVIEISGDDIVLSFEMFVAIQFIFDNRKIDENEVIVTHYSSLIEKESGLDCKKEIIRLALIKGEYHG